MSDLDPSHAEAGSASESASVVQSLPDGVALWLVRHGETEWSRSGQHTGRTDIALTPAGYTQGAVAGAVVRAELTARPYVLCSPLQRARDTATAAGWTPDALDDDLREWDYGRYEGLTSAAIRAQRPGWSLWSDGVLDGESIDDVGARADRVLARVTPLLPDRPVVLIAHGHISRVIAARWLSLPASGGAHFLLGTAAPSKLSAQYGDRVIERWNLPLAPA